jgi:hypothetical protein
LTEPQKITLSNVLWGLVIPLIIGIVIVIFPAVIRPLLDSAFPAPSMTSAGSPYAFLTVIFTHGIALMAVFGVPLFLGITWNQWAGGAAGFITGTLYYVAFAGYNIQYSIAYFGSSPNLYADPSFIGNYIVGGILIGYIAGALNNRSMRIKRMFGAAITAVLAVGIFQFILNYTVAFASYMTQSDPLNALWQTLLPLVILGIIVPFIARISAGSELGYHPHQ